MTTHARARRAEARGTVAAAVLVLAACAGPSAGEGADPAVAGNAAAAEGVAAAGDVAGAEDAAAARDAPSAAAATAPTCAARLPDGFLRARLAGALERELDWSAAEMRCDGMNRPDRLGLRLSFAGQAGEVPLTFVFAAPRLARGVAARAVPVNLTLVLPDGRIYGTLGEDRCVLDEVRQAPLGDDPAGGTRWRVEARGFCLEPARAIGGDDLPAGDAILPATFDFAGIVTWEADPATP